MVASAIVSPWPPSGRRPGPAWAWAPPRPFPVHVWLAQRPTRPTPAQPCAAPASVPARPGGLSPTPPAAHPPTRSAGFQPARPVGSPPPSLIEPPPACSAGFQPARPVGSPPPAPAEDAPACSAGFQPARPVGLLPLSPTEQPLARPPNLAEKLAKLLGIPPLAPAVQAPRQHGAGAPGGASSGAMASPPARPRGAPEMLPLASSGSGTGTRTGRAGFQPALHAGASSVGGVGNEPTGRAGWKPALHAGATSSSQPAQPSKAAVAVSRLDLELRLLFSRGPLPLDDERLAALRDELDQRAWSLTSAIGAPRPADPAWPTVPRPDTPLEKRRARLVADVNLGLALVEVSQSRYPRPVRNVLLVRQASYIGRRLEEVLTDPAAGSFAQEWKYLLEGLRRRR